MGVARLLSGQLRGTLDRHRCRKTSGSCHFVVGHNETVATGIGEGGHVKVRGSVVVEGVALRGDTHARDDRCGRGRHGGAGSGALRGMKAAKFATALFAKSTN